MRDLRYAWRALLKSPVIAIVAVLSLALGIGANTAIFSVINALLLRSLPIHDPQQLVSIYTIHPEDAGQQDPLSLSMFNELRKQQQVFSGMFGWGGDALSSFEAEGRYFPGGLTTVTGDYYGVLGVKPLLGRLIQPADVALYTGTSAQVAVLSYRCWQNHFHGDPAVIGKTIPQG
jgi:putative ABC transport system permease protein